jgi:GTP cyclohydrolase IA
VRALLPAPPSEIRTPATGREGEVSVRLEEYHHENGGGAERNGQVEVLVRDLLTTLGENPDRAGLVDTPGRVARSYATLLSGYGRDFAREIRTFDNEAGYDSVVLSSGIEFFSTCEHHLLPFWGHASIGYVPGERIIGLSKLSRVVDIYSRRLQDQERLTVQIADELMDVLKPRGVAVLLRARHLCSVARGVEKKDSSMVTVIYRGSFEGDAALQANFLTLGGMQQ